MKRILLASDGSAHSLKAANLVGRLFGSVQDCHVTILYVYPKSGIPVATDTFGNPVTPDVPLDVMIERAAEPVFKATREALGLAEGCVDTRTATGHVAEEILLAAQEGKFDLIAMGSRGLGPVEEVVLGSVTYRVLHTAHIPVLVAR